MNTRVILDGQVTDLEMQRLIATRDWAATSLGSAASWPQSLKTVVSVIVGSPLAMTVLWGPSLVQIYNAAYAQICGERHPEALGQPTKTCWPEVWAFNEPIYEAVRRGEVRSFERQLLPIVRQGAMQDAWFDLTYSPVHDESDGVAGVLVTVVESTHHVRLAHASQIAMAESERLRALFDSAPGFVAIMKGPDHVFEFANQAYMRLVGGRPVVGLPVREVVPETVDQGFIELLNQVYASGEPHVGTSAPLRLVPPGGGAPENRFIDFLYAPMFDLDGGVTGVFLQGADATDRMLAAERQALFNNELNHRVKNTLATVLSLAMLTRKSAKSVQAFTEAFTNRIGAMALTHDLLTSKEWRSVQVCELLNLELAPYLGDSGQVVLKCASMAVTADAAVNLSLITHELLTNAAKYGALSSPEGRLLIHCERAASGAVLTWQETVDHIVPPASGGGFGSRLITRLALGLGGGADIELLPSGLRAVIRFALDDALSPDQPAQT